MLENLACISDFYSKANSFLRFLEFSTLNEDPLGRSGRQKETKKKLYDFTRVSLESGKYKNILRQFSYANRFCT